MKRFEVQARQLCSKKKYIPVYKQEKKFKGLFKTWTGANNHINRVCGFYPGIEFRVKEITLESCPSCGKEINPKLNFNGIRPETDDIESFHNG
jgi:ribosomal protein L32